MPTTDVAYVASGKASQAVAMTGDEQDAAALAEEAKLEIKGSYGSKVRALFASMIAKLPYVACGRLL